MKSTNMESASPAIKLKTLLKLTMVAEKVIKRKLELVSDHEILTKRLEKFKIKQI